MVDHEGTWMLFEHCPSPKDICLFWVSLVLDTVGFERVHMSTRGYSICAYEH